ncbi:hypothetical protein [Phaeobacter sp. HF9A]|uniref:hypothetical protein n=1 Tax=Phaeobacter sp. HF9A TaxID=2721561 RepID=UPI00143102E2|nr:hypothetical protein [Phaeobacter sp. HF9A]NIZ15519.1 hypothetical protein [Phaeobacter sp. HF9A]
MTTHPARHLPDMAQDSPLLRRLRALAAPPSRQHPALPERILHHIDTTILPRALILAVEGAPLARFDITQRALLRMEGPDGALESHEFNSAREAAPRFAETLLRLSAHVPDHARITLTAEARPLRSATTQCSAALLQEALAGLAAASPEEALTKACASALARGRLEGETGHITCDGPRPELYPVAEVALSRLWQEQQHRAPQAQPLPAGKPLLRLTQLSAASSLAVVSQRGNHVALLLPPEAAELLARHWQRGTA